jgi:hypothetical protein
MRVFTLTLTLILLAAHSALAQKVVVELDEATDFSKYKIFAILDGQMHSKNRGRNSELVELSAELGIRVVDFSDMSVEEVAQAPLSLLWRPCPSCVSTTNPFVSRLADRGREAGCSMHTGASQRISSRRACARASV